MSWNTLTPQVQNELRIKLTQKQLDVLMLWLAGCSYQRTAAMLGISVRTVRTHLHRARVIHDQLTKEEAA